MRDVIKVQRDRYSDIAAQLYGALIDVGMHLRGVKPSASSKSYGDKLDRARKRIEKTLESAERRWPK